MHYQSRQPEGYTSGSGLPTGGLPSRSGLESIDRDPSNTNHAKRRVTPPGVAYQLEGFPLGVVSNRDITTLSYAFQRLLKGGTRRHIGKSMTSVVMKFF